MYTSALATINVRGSRDDLSQTTMRLKREVNVKLFPHFATASQRAQRPEELLHELGCSIQSICEYTIDIEREVKVSPGYVKGARGNDLLGWIDGITCLKSFRRCMLRLPVLRRLRADWPAVSDLGTGVAGLYPVGRRKLIPGCTASNGGCITPVMYVVVDVFQIFCKIGS